MDDEIRNKIGAVFRTESRYALATLYRIFGDFDLAEDTLQEAFTSALEKWPHDGIPDNPKAWLISVARNKAIDHIRRENRIVRGLDAFDEIAHIDVLNDQEIEDDFLRLIFMCSSPLLSVEAQVALTLREVCSLTTEEVARAFLLPEPTLAQRIVRAKAKLKESHAAFEVPPSEELPSRLSSVLRVIYLIFNEGYYASSGESLTRADLSIEAIRLGEILCKLLPQSEVLGLTALMCLSESRRDARSSDGEIVLLEDQDRSLWNRKLIATGNEHLTRAIELTTGGYYVLQACITAEHTNALSSKQTNWANIVRLYDRLDELSPSPVVKLNRAVAVAMYGQIEEGLRQVTDLSLGELRGYGLAHSARADLLRRLGKVEEAVAAYKEALTLTHLAPEKRFLEKRLGEIQTKVL